MSGQPDPATFIECRVGEITEVKTIEGSNKLYSCEVDIGNGQTKHVVTAARKFYTIDDLKGKKVCVFINAEQGELFDEISEAMLLGCATDENHVELLEPPLDDEPGDRIYFGDYNSEEDDLPTDQNNRHWKRMLHDLKVDNNGEAQYKGESIYTDYGNVTAPTLRNCDFH